MSCSPGARAGCFALASGSGLPCTAVKDKVHHSRSSSGPSWEKGNAFLSAVVGRFAARVQQVRLWSSASRDLGGLAAGNTLKSGVLVFLVAWCSNTRFLCLVQASREAAPSPSDPPAPRSLSALTARSFWDQISPEMSSEELGSGLKELNGEGTGRRSKLLSLKLVERRLGA